MSNENKKQMSVVKKMMIALVGGLVVGLIFMFIRSSLLDSGNEATWNMINKILFQDITAEDGTGALGLLYIIGQLFMRGLQAAIVPLVLVSLSLAMCSISSSTKLGRIAGRTVLGFVCFYVVGAFCGGVVAYLMKSAGLFNVNLPAEAVTDAATIDAFNPLATIVTAVPSNITEVFSSNNSILAVVVVAIVIGLCLQALGEKGEPLKKVFESVSEVVNMYLTFLINKVGPVAIFCLVSRTFAIYGTEYLAPAAAYIVGAMITLFILVVTLYPIGIWLTTRLNPMKFLKKIAKVGVFGFSVNSSAATLPLNTRTNLDELGCSQEITSFVLPTGMTINMNGTTVMHMFAVTFIATSAGIDVTPANLVVVAFLSICAAMGCPAIPIAGTTLIVTILSGMGWTSDACMIAYALVVAINRPVEMALLPLNVIGDAATNVIVNAKEKELNKEVYNS
ncbi:sodium:dicarboxylate symporter [Claveliimonas bilis]|uniref:dicarboxylate/amino acid:cation symporter n=1 Tax=Claveliimonas bilis TaxID=3028070 RepID=UPI001E36EDA1|nr:dicarboxylate/amino acid:cation symporter [Claveliimonas bilis]BCZ27611.1 sodium:dicarboxylate symporter [Claveliimonas bilis]BDZ83700.1 sodium:dicarboxylate symporter [Claveliimonas bilis]